MKFFRFTIFALLVWGGMAADLHAFERVLYYDTFEEFDTRNGGYILPEGVERVRYGGRLYFTEVEVEAPSSAGDTRALAQFVTDPSGLSLTVLKLEDADRLPGDGSLGADGSVSLLESIILDQGDRSGRSVVAWMAIPYQDGEVGGTMFPETDSAIDAGPEGLNLIGFGGVQRDFDTGEPIPGMDFSGQIILNEGRGATLTPLGIGYTVNAPVFFVLDFDLETSLYDLYINGVPVREDIPFFDVAGETGKTLRELELISNVRGIGTFAYDNLYQIDPESPYEPVEFRTPVIAGDAELIPLFMESFDDEDLGGLSDVSTGDMVGSAVLATENVSVVEDISDQSPARLIIPSDGSYEGVFAEPQDESDKIRYSFCITPGADAAVSFYLDDQEIMQLAPNGGLAFDQDGDGRFDQPNIPVLANLPHWFSITFDPVSNMFFVKVYRATSATDPQTAVLQGTGVLPADLDLTHFRFKTETGSAFLDDVLAVELNETPEGSDENRYRAVVHENFESVQAGATTLFGGNHQVVSDPTAWSLRVLSTVGGNDVVLFDGAEIERSMRVSWTAVPAGVESGEIEFTLAGGFSLTMAVPYEADEINRISVIFDLYQGTLTILSDGDEIIDGPLPIEFEKETVTGVSLRTPGSDIVLYDDLLVVADHFGAFFEPKEYVAPRVGSNRAILFEEDFENNPARSEQKVDEFDPRRSGLPIPTSSSGFSDLAEEDVAGTNLIVGAPSAEAAYIEDPDGSSLYSLYINDRFAPQDFGAFASALALHPISTLRTVPYSFVVPVLAQSPSKRYVHIQWTATAGQVDETGMALFLSAPATAVTMRSGSLSVPAPSGDAIAAFGADGTILANSGAGELESLGLEYEIGLPVHFMVRIDRTARTFDLLLEGRTVISQAPLAVDPQDAGFLNRFGWFSTLAGSGSDFQQVHSGGGLFVIDDIRVSESDMFTNVDAYQVY